jgi:hypothetical protein
METIERLIDNYKQSLPDNFLLNLKISQDEVKIK